MKEGLASGDLPDIEKPDYGSPCNGCGVCCITTPCMLARIVLEGAQEGRACPALVVCDGRFQCGLVLDPGEFIGREKAASVGEEALRSSAAFLVGAETSCDSWLDHDEPTDEQKRENHEASVERAPLAAHCLRIWGVATGRN